MPENEQFTQEQMNEALFAQLVFMFQGAAYQHMGKVKNPMTDKIERDMDQARHAIDVLSMLEAKTQGNLGDEEKTLLEHALYELRLNFMDEVKKGTTETTAGGAEEEGGEEASSEESEEKQEQEE